MIMMTLERNYDNCLLAGSPCKVNKDSCDRLWVRGVPCTRYEPKPDLDTLAERLEVKFDHVNARLDQLLLYAEGGKPE